PEHRDDPDGEQDLLAKIRDLERVDEGLEHGSCGPLGGSWSERSVYRLRISTEPPACSILARAEAETAWTRTVSARSSSPWPRTFTGAFFRTRPRSRRVTGVTSAPASNAWPS